MLCVHTARHPRRVACLLLSLNPGRRLVHFRLCVHSGHLLPRHLLRLISTFQLLLRLHIGSELVLLIHHHLVSDGVIVFCLLSVSHLDIADETGEDKQDHEKARNPLENENWVLATVRLPVLLELLPLLALASGILLLMLLLALVVLLEFLLVLTLLLGLLVLVLLVSGTTATIGLLISLLLLLTHSFELILLPEEFLVVLARVPGLPLVRIAILVTIVVGSALLVRPAILEWAAAPRALIVLLLCPLLLLLASRVVAWLLV